VFCILSFSNRLSSTGKALVCLSARNNLVAINLPNWMSKKAISELVLLEACSSELVGTCKRRGLEINLMQEWMVVLHLFPFKLIIIGQFL
jgi:hypothetical protein